jgi:hypothetical protein
LRLARGAYRGEIILIKVFIDWHKRFKSREDAMMLHEAIT